MPLELGWRPSPASMTPALTSSSLNFPMSVRSFSLGITPASEFLVAFTITMTRIVVLPSLAFQRGDEREPRGSTWGMLFFVADRDTRETLNNSPATDHGIEDWPVRVGKRRLRRREPRGRRASGAGR